jgi:hypothetical protein
MPGLIGKIVLFYKKNKIPATFCRYVPHINCFFNSR